jgi:NADH dehydrogenase FAD-containing subunit
VLLFARCARRSSRNPFLHLFSTPHSEQFHESKGVTFHGNAKCTEITETSVTFKDASGEKTVLDADVVVMAVGVGPATGYLKDSGIQTLKDGSLEVDEYLAVKGVNDVYAIGTSK